MAGEGVAEEYIESVREDIEKEREEFNAAVEVAREKVKGLVNEGRKCLEAGKFSNALALLKEAKKLSPLDNEIAKLLIDIRRAKRKRILEIVVIVIGLVGLWTWIRYEANADNRRLLREASELGRSGRYIEAIERLNRVESIPWLLINKPEVPLVWLEAMKRQCNDCNDALLRALMAKDKRDWAGVLAAVEEALKLDAENAEAQALKDEAQGQLTRQVDLGNGVKMVLCWIPAGEFMMGSPENETERDSDEGPQHKVRISSGFWMGKYEVTQRQYRQLMGDNPSWFKNAGPDAPVENVTWHEATNFCAKLQARLPSELKGRTVRLPTEAEWEYACRAGTKTAFHYGDSLDSNMANFNGNYPYGSGKKGVYRETTVKVGSFKPNAWGLCGVDPF